MTTTAAEIRREMEMERVVDLVSSLCERTLDSSAAPVGALKTALRILGRSYDHSLLERKDFERETWARIQQYVLQKNPRDQEMLLLLNRVRERFQLFVAGSMHRERRAAHMAAARGGNAGVDDDAMSAPPDPQTALVMKKMVVMLERYSHLQHAASRAPLFFSLEDALAARSASLGGSGTRPQQQQQQQLHHHQQQHGVPLPDLLSSLPTADRPPMPPVPPSSTTAAEKPSSIRDLLAGRERQRELESSRQDDNSRRARAAAVAALSSEADLLQDLLYVFQGIDGRHIVFNKEDNAYILDPNLDLPVADRDMVMDMCELGWLFKRVQTYVDTASNAEFAGLAGQAFAFALQEELMEFFRLVAVMETQLNAWRAGAEGANDLSLRQFFVALQAPWERIKLMAVLTDGVGQLRGGALASSLHAHTRHGDPVVHSFVQKIMARVCAPIFASIVRWVTEGELADPYHELFIAQDERVPPEDLWHAKYSLRESMLLTFMPREEAERILVIGKSINFIRRCCADNQWVVDFSDRGRIARALRAHTNAGQKQLQQGDQPGDDEQRQQNGPRGLHGSEQVQLSDVQYGNPAVLHALLSVSAERTDEHLLQLMMDEYKLMEHLHAFKKFMLLGQGDFVTVLMDTLGPELSSSAADLLRHNLSGILESALRSSNAQYEPQYVQGRLQVRLLQANPGDTGWEIFTLDYVVDSPLTAVVHRQASAQYQVVFRMLWRLKRVEWSLNGAWRHHLVALHGRAHQLLPSLRNTFHRSMLLRHEMLHFVTNLSNYMMFEVLETSWTNLVENVRQATNLHSVILAHDRYLEEVLRKALFTQSAEEVTVCVRNVLDVIVRFCALQETLFNEALYQVDQIRERQRVARRRERQGQWGMSEADYDDELERDIASVPRYLLGQIDECADQYAGHFGQLLELLGRQDAEILRFLTFRLDFNEFYHKQAQAQTGSANTSTASATPPATSASASAAATAAAPAVRTPARPTGGGGGSVALPTPDLNQYAPYR